MKKLQKQIIAINFKNEKKNDKKINNKIIKKNKRLKTRTLH